MGPAADPSRPHLFTWTQGLGCEGRLLFHFFLLFTHTRPFPPRGLLAFFSLLCSVILPALLPRSGSFCLSPVSSDLLYLSASDSLDRPPGQD